MITMTDWRVHVPDEDAQLGHETETGVARLEIQLDDSYDGWEFKLDARSEHNNLDVYDFVHGGNIIYFDIVDELGLTSGHYVCQVRGVSGDKRQLSNVFCLYVGDSIGAITVLERVPVAELFQLEQRLTELKTTCEDLTQKSTGAASDAAESEIRASEAADRAEAMYSGIVQSHFELNDTGHLLWICADVSSN